VQIGGEKLMDADERYYGFYKPIYDRMVQAEAENERLRAALQRVAAIRPEKPNTSDFEQDDFGARGHAVAMQQWGIGEIAREALDETNPILRT
jgi:hypothetical protein